MNTPLFQVPSTEFEPLPVPKDDVEVVKSSISAIVVAAIAGRVVSI